SCVSPGCSLKGRPANPAERGGASLGSTETPRLPGGLVTESTRIQDADRWLRVAALGFACAAGFGTAVAIRDDLPGEPLGIRVPLTVPTGILVGWGGAVAAPWPMPVAAVTAAFRASRADSRAWPALVCACLGIGGIIGILIEPVTYQPRSWTPATRAAVLLHVAGSAGLAATGLRCLKRARSHKTR